MAKRPVQAGDNRDDLELKKFVYDPTTKESWIRFDDEALIDAINNSGGNSDTQAEIVNESLLANTEKEIDCGTNVKAIYLRSRNSEVLKLAYNIGETSSQFITIKKGCNFKDNSFYTNLKIYLLCTVNDTVEILIQRTI